MLIIGGNVQQPLDYSSIQNDLPWNSFHGIYDFLWSPTLIQSWSVWLIGSSGVRGRHFQSKIIKGVVTIFLASCMFSVTLIVWKYDPSLWRSSHTDNQCRFANHMIEPPWKWILPSVKPYRWQQPWSASSLHPHRSCWPKTNHLTHCQIPAQKNYKRS